MLFGVGGQVGRELVHSLADLGRVTALDRHQADLADLVSLPHVIRGAGPDVIVNAAAYTAVDQAEAEEALAQRINGAAVGVLAAEARRLGALLIHYSTDYVFDGSQSEPYTEDDTPAPLNAYGRSKLAGEQALQASGADWLCLRTSWVYAAQGRNFLTTVQRLVHEREILRIVADQIGAPTWARSIAEATREIIRYALTERAAGVFRAALYHLSAAGSTSWHGFAHAILQQARRHGGSDGLKTRHIEAIASAEYPTPARRPKNSRLNSDRLAAQYGIRLAAWDQELAACFAASGRVRMAQDDALERRNTSG